MFKKCIAITFAVLLAACSNPQGPSPVPDQTPSAVLPTPGAPPSTTPPVTAPPGPSFEGKILPFAGWDVKNTSGNITYFDCN
jgi:hypothetical protein